MRGRRVRAGGAGWYTRGEAWGGAAAPYDASSTERIMSDIILD